MKPAKLLYWPSAKAAPAPEQPTRVVQEFDLAGTLAYPFVGLELRAFIELRQLCESHARAGDGNEVVVSVADLRRLCSALDSKPPSPRWVSWVMQFLQQVNVIARVPRAGQPNGWRILPQAQWLDPTRWPDLRKQIYRTGKNTRKSKTQTTRMNNVIRVNHWSPPNDEIGDPLKGPAAEIYQEVFQRSATIDFATRFLAQITDQSDLLIWRKVVQWYRFKYQKGNRPPNPKTLWDMFLDWRDNPMLVLDVPQSIILPPAKTQAASPEVQHGNQRTNRNSIAAADTLSLFDELPTEPTLE